MLLRMPRLMSIMWRSLKQEHQVLTILKHMIIMHMLKRNKKVLLGNTQEELFLNEDEWL